jgi:hypothetical protein
MRLGRVKKLLIQSYEAGKNDMWEGSFKEWLEEQLKKNI